LPKVISAANAVVPVVILHVADHRGRGGPGRKRRRNSGIEMRSGLRKGGLFQQQAEEQRVEVG